MTYYIGEVHGNSCQFGLHGCGGSVDFTLLLCPLEISVRKLYIFAISAATLPSSQSEMVSLAVAAVSVFWGR